jgi:hypothetical protein
MPPKWACKKGQRIVPCKSDLCHCRLPPFSFIFCAAKSPKNGQFPQHFLHRFSHYFKLSF